MIQRPVFCNNIEKLVARKPLFVYFVMYSLKFLLNLLPYL